jgi:RNA polymerase sigma-70 factor (ECF subfamily)
MIAFVLASLRSLAALPSREATVPASPSEVDFAALYRDSFPFVFRSLRRLGVPNQAVDDAVQEVFLIAHQRLSTFDGRSSLKTWLFGILLNVVRRRRRAAARHGEAAPLPELRDEAGLDPHELLRKREAGRFLYRFLNRLDDAKREVFVLCEVEQLTAPEAAKLTGVPLPTVYSRLRLARAAFERAVARHRAQEPR